MRTWFWEQGVTGSEPFFYLRKWNKTQLFGPIAAQMRTKLLPDCHHQGSFAHNNS